MATVPHVTSGLGLRKFQADWFLLTRVYYEGLFLLLFPPPRFQNFSSTIFIIFAPRIFIMLILFYQQTQIYLTYKILKFSPQHSVLNILNVWTDQVSYPYKARNELYYNFYFMDKS